MTPGNVSVRGTKYHRSLGVGDDEIRAINVIKIDSHFAHKFVAPGH